MSRKLRTAIAAPLLAPLLALSLGACEVGAPALLAGASLVSIAHTDKTVTDHVTTWAFDKDCSTVSFANGEDYCQDFVTEEELRAAEAEEAARRAQTYCYRTLGTVNCFRQPDALASTGQRVR